MLAGKITDNFRQSKTGSAPDRKLSSRLKTPVKHAANDEIVLPGRAVDDMLREFDLSSKYGPSLGLTRICRWERAHKLGLSPPEEIITILRQLPRFSLAELCF